MKRVFDEDPWTIDIKWSRPKAYAAVVADKSGTEDDASLYSILARYRSGPRKLFYVGKTFSYFVSTRLSQRDHKARLAKFVQAHPRHSFEVSYGVIKCTKLTRKRLGEIEQLLIYSSDPVHSKNVRNFYDHCVSDAYHIRNNGSRCSLPKTIALGVFVG